MHGIIKRSEVWKKNKLWMPERVPETFERKKIWALDSDRGNRRKTKKRENVALPLWLWKNDKSQNGFADKRKDNKLWMLKVAA